MAKKKTKKKVAKKKATKKAKKRAVKKKASKKKAAKADGDAAKKKKKKKKKKRKSRKKATVIRHTVYWGVFNHAMKRVALYEFNQKKAAQKKVSDLNESGKPPHFVQKVKEEFEELLNPEEETETETK